MTARRIMFFVTTVFLSAVYAADINPISFTGRDAVEAVSFEHMDTRVSNSITYREWVDGVTMPGWSAWVNDAPADCFNLTHGGCPVAGIQVLADPKNNHRGIAIGTFLNSATANAMIAVAIRNDSRGSIDSIKLRIGQVQWMGGTVSPVDLCAGWWRTGEQNWNREETIDLRHFVADPKGRLPTPLFFEQTVTLNNINWAPGEILWLRWTDKLLERGGNAGAGIASLKISM